MNLSSINSSSLFANAIASTGRTSAATGDTSSSAGGVAGPRHRQRDGEEFMQAVQQAFSQMGINLPTPSSAVSSGQQNQASGGSVSGSQAIAQDMHQLMHDLFAALRQGQSSAGAAADRDHDRSPSSAVNAGYANFSSGLQGLVQQLASGSTSTNGPLSALQTDFATLLTEVQKQSGGNSNAAGSATTSQSPTLQSFLQNLLNNLAGQSPVAAAVGSVVSAVA